MLILCLGCGGAQGAQTDSPVAEDGDQALSVSSQAQQAHELQVACLAGGGTWAGGRCERPTSEASAKNTGQPTVVKSSRSESASTMSKPGGHDHGSHSHETAAPPARSGMAAGLRVLNITSVPTATLEGDATRASSLMANRQSDVLVVIYPIGSYIADVLPGTWSPDGNPEHGASFAKFERVISQEQVEVMLGEKAVQAVQAVRAA